MKIMESSREVFVVVFLTSYVDPQATKIHQNLKKKNPTEKKYKSLF